VSTEPTEVDRLRLAVSLAQELGRAYRGDWSDFDGRSLRNELDALSDIVSGKADAAGFRASADLCPRGGGHWTEYCTSDCGARS
jgi:hypothetical protein